MGAAPMKKKAAAMKAMKAMKKKVVSKIAKGKMARAVVFRGGKEKTLGGMNKSMLMKNKRGKIVSKKASANGKKAYARVQGWIKAVQAARKALSITGFAPVGGKTAAGKALYAKAKAIQQGA